jgi:hypothetical protein
MTAYHEVPRENDAAVSHKMNHEHVAQHAAGGHSHHSKQFMEHAAGHQFEQDKVRAMCGGGKAK